MTKKRKPKVSRGPYDKHKTTRRLYDYNGRAVLSGGSEIDDCNVYCNSADEALIASAPDLLKTLTAILNSGYTPIVGKCVEANRQEVVDFWKREESLGRGDARIVLDALAAIAKATTPSS